MGDGADDAFELALQHEFEYESNPELYVRPHILKTCRKCGEQNLHWEKTNGVWQLYKTDGTAHQCACVGVVCRFCRMDGLSWRQTNDGWRLYKDGVIHLCKVITPPGMNPRAILRE